MVEIINELIEKELEEETKEVAKESVKATTKTESLGEDEDLLVRLFGNVDFRGLIEAIDRILRNPIVVGFIKQRYGIEPVIPELEYKVKRNSLNPTVILQFLENFLNSLDENLTVRELKAYLQENKARLLMILKQQLENAK